MSLLLDALRRAEEAKKAARDAADAPAATMPDDALSLTPLEPTPQDDASPPLMTRENLPNISQAVVTLDDDLAAAAAPTGAAAKSAARPARPHAAAPDEATTAAHRQTARQLFEAGTPAYNPRRPFYFVLGALGLTALGIVGWFWYQLQPSAGAVAPTAARRPAVTAPATVAATTTQPPAAARARADAETASAANRAQAANETNTANVANATGAAAQAETASLAAAPASAAAPLHTAAHASAHPAAPVTPVTPVTPRARAPQHDAAPVLTHAPLPGPSPTEQGYAAFERGDIDAARIQYQAALAQDPLNRDALLGLAAIDVRTQHYASAEARYLKLLERDPRDAYAHAGLIGLRGRGDPRATESRLKNLLAQQPDSNVLNFALGNQYANEGRWAEAQQAYFHAWASDPANADYAFNLAVSLDHLREPRLAADYYRKALALAGARPVAFDPAQAAARLRELAP